MTTNTAPRELLQTAMDLSPNNLRRMADALDWPTIADIIDKVPTGQVCWTNPHKNAYRTPKRSVFWDMLVQKGLAARRDIGPVTIRGVRREVAYLYSVTAKGRHCLRLRMEATRLALTLEVKS